MRAFLIASIASVSIAVAVSTAQGQVEGRVFLPTLETVSIHEFNGFVGIADGSPLPNGTSVPDLSGHNLNGTVEGNDQGELTVVAGDPNFDLPAGADRACRRAANATLGVRVAVNDDNDAYEMSEVDDFSIELYVSRETIPLSANWGILAGTWHSRNLIDDSAGDPDHNGAWYGYGLIRWDEAAFPTGGWQWILSPVVDGQPVIGHDTSEHKLPENGFEIPDGLHYVVLSMDRVAQTATGYVDGVQVGQLLLDPTWAFTTPEGRDHARFLYFTGENDSTLDTWMPAPMGTTIEAARVQRRALRSDDVVEIWGNIQSGISSPPPTDKPVAVIVASASSVVPGQCVLLDSAGSLPGTGRTITTYEWKIGDAAPATGDSTKEVSFASADPAKVTVTLTIVNDAGAISEASTVIEIANQGAAAAIAAKLGDRDVSGKSILIPLGSVLTLDGTTSSSVVPAGALVCPMAAGAPVTPLAISEYRWYLDSDGTVDETQPSFDTDPFDTVGTFTIGLVVANAAGVVSDRVDIEVKVGDPKGNTRIFHPTGDSLFLFDFDEATPGVVADATVFPDLSGNNLDLQVFDPIGGVIEIRDGATGLPGSRSLAFVPDPHVNGPRGVIPQDFDLLEMAPEMDFTFELYVRPGEADLPEWGDVAGTFKARTDGTEESPRYGWGIIKSSENSAENHTTGYSFIVCNGLEGGTTGEKQALFQLEKGVFSYVACVMDRLNQKQTVYVNGAKAAEYWAAIDPTWDFRNPNPAAYPKAPFYLFTREQVDGQFSNCPPDVHVDALRFQEAALTEAEVAQNWADIVAGKGADAPSEGPPNAPKNLTATGGPGKVDLAWDEPDAGPSFTGYAVYRGGEKIADVPATPRAYADTGLAAGNYCYKVAATRGGVKGPESNEACAPVVGGGFRRGDADGSGKLDLTDAIATLQFLYMGYTAPACKDAADTDDSGILDLTDAIASLQFQFMGGTAPADPGPTNCGPDPTPGDEYTDCTYTNC
jgi:hypothetical protein